MNLAPLLDASPAIQAHVVTVIPAAILGPYIFANRKGTPIHKMLGRIWLFLMVISALSSLFIHSINLFYGFSPIHILSLFVLYGSYKVISEARARRMANHRTWAIGIYLGGIVGAGTFTLLPGRIMNEVLLDGPFDFSRIVTLAIVLSLFGYASYLALKGRLGKI
jgi:uncharacterized membrane protein